MGVKVSGDCARCRKPTSKIIGPLLDHADFVRVREALLCERCIAGTHRYDVKFVSPEATMSDEGPHPDMFEPAKTNASGAHFGDGVVVGYEADKRPESVLVGGHPNGLVKQWAAKPQLDDPGESLADAEIRAEMARTQRYIQIIQPAMAILMPQITVIERRVTDVYVSMGDLKREQRRAALFQTLILLVTCVYFILTYYFKK